MDSNSLAPETAVAIVGGIVSVMGALITMFTILRKLPSEVRAVDGDTQQALATASKAIADGAVVTNNYLRQQIEDMQEENAKYKADCEVKQQKNETRIMELARLVETLQQTVTQQSKELDKYKDWADRLSHQVQATGQQPVKF